MKEIIYFDEKRLNSYIDQILFREKRGIRINVDNLEFKFPFEFGINFSPAKKNDHLSPYRKIQKVWAYIEENNAYHDARPGPMGVNYQIIREFVDVSEILLTSIADRNEVLMRFWASKIASGDGPIILLLCSNIRYSDMPAYVGVDNKSSGFTALHRFLYEFRDEINQSPMGQHIPDHEWTRQGTLGSLEHPYFLSQDENLNPDIISTFVENLDVCFRNNGATVVGQRKVEVVYVVRELGQPSGGQPFHVFGYPLWMLKF